MPQGGGTTAVGVFTENGSGGFVEDLSFFGGNIGFVVGSQQFTARNLQFTSCATAIKHIWNWFFTWKSISVFSCYIAIDCTQVGGANPDGGCKHLDSLLLTLIVPTFQCHRYLYGVHANRNSIFSTGSHRIDILRHRHISIRPIRLGLGLGLGSCGQCQVIMEEAALYATKTCISGGSRLVRGSRFVNI